MKQKLISALDAQDYDEVARLALADRRALTKLIGLATDKNDVRCWRSIEAMGIASAAVVSHGDVQRVRNLVQRILWSAREESGGMGWSAPELLAEIASASPRQFPDIPPIIVSLFCEDEENVFRKGVLWAIAHMAEAGITDVPGAVEVVLDSLENADAQVRGLAVRAAALAGIDVASDKLQGIGRDESLYVIYRNGELQQEPVADAAKTALSG